MVKQGPQALIQHRLLHPGQEPKVLQAELHQLGKEGRIIDREAIRLIAARNLIVIHHNQNSKGAKASGIDKENEVEQD